MSTVGYILIFTFIGSLGSLVGGIILLSKEKIAIKISGYLASFAAGTLLGTAFFDLLPEATHEAENTTIDVYLWSLMGILMFFIISRFLHWFHHHEESEHVHEERQATIPLIVISDTLHNFLDGVVIAATFLVSIPLGIITTLAVAAHEIPQEIGDFGLLLSRGLSRKKVILVNVISALFAFFGAILTLLFGEVIERNLSIFLALTAGFFIYIALSDIVPGIHHERRRTPAIIGSIMLLLGVVLIWVSTTLLEGFH